VHAIQLQARESECLPRHGARSEGKDFTSEDTSQMYPTLMGHCECFPIQSPFAPVLRNVLFSFGGKEIHCELFGPLDLCADLLDALVCAYVVVVTRLFLLLFLMSHHRCAQVDLVAIRLHFNLVRCSQTKKKLRKQVTRSFSGITSQHSSVGGSPHLLPCAAPSALSWVELFNLR
jgi:hypothetical protein